MRFRVKRYFKFWKGYSYLKFKVAYIKKVKHKMIDKTDKTVVGRYDFLT